MKILAFSDIHANISNKLTYNIENILKENKIDILVCAGDFSSNEKNAYLFAEWFSSFDCKYKILVGGNHDKVLISENSSLFKKNLREMDILYLENESIIINNKKIFCSPYTPTFMNWAFMKDELELTKIWEMIPDDINILITHGPAFKILDKIFDRKLKKYINVGSITLKERINELKKLECHIFGHIHENYGYKKIDDINYYNVSLLNEEYKLKNNPIIIKLKDI